MSSLLITLISLLIVLTRFFTNNSYFILYVISLWLYLVLVSAFKNIKIGNMIKKYYDNGYHCVLERNITKIIIKIFVINLLMLIFMTGSGVLLSKVLNLDYLWLIFVIFGISIWVSPTLNILNDYLNQYKNKIKLNISYLLINVFYFVFMILIIFNILKINDLIEIIILSLGPLFSGILIIIYVLSIVKSKNMNNKKEEISCNYNKDIKKIISSNLYLSLIDIIKYGYLYISIIITYKLCLKYKPLLIDSNLITNAYFYMIVLILPLLVLLIKKIKKHINNLDLLNEDNLKKNIQNLYYKYIVNLLPLVIITSFASYPISILVFKDNGITLGLLIIMIFIYTIYYITLQLLITLKNSKKITLFLISGFIVNILIIIPTIESFYRMGFLLTYGAILTIAISLIVSIVLGIYYLNKKYKFNFNEMFEKSLDIIYKSIILIIVLLIIQYLIMKIFDGILENAFSIIAYLGILLIYIKINDLKNHKSIV